MGSAPVILRCDAEVQHDGVAAGDGAHVAEPFDAGAVAGGEQDERSGGDPDPHAA